MSNTCRCSDSACSAAPWAKWIACCHDCPFEPYPYPHYSRRARPSQQSAPARPAAWSASGPDGRRMIQVHSPINPDHPRSPSCASSIDRPCREQIGQTRSPTRTVPLPATEGSSPSRLFWPLAATRVPSQIADRLESSAQYRNMFQTSARKFRVPA